MMTKNQSVKQININNILNDFPIYWKRSQHIHGLKTIISIVSLILVRCMKIGYDVTCFKKNITDTVAFKNGVTCKQTRTCVG